MNGHIRQKSLLVVLAIALLIAALRFGFSLLGFERIPIANQGPSLGPKKAPLPTPGYQLAVLRLADLERVPASTMPGRNPWSFVDPLPRPTSSLARSQSPALPRTAPEAPEIPRNPYPEFTWRYLGRFGPPEKKIAVFVDGNRVLNRLEGGVIDGRFVVARIGYESVEIRYVEFPEAPARRVGVTPR